MKILKQKYFGNQRLDFIIITASTIICSLINFIYSVYARKYVRPVDYGIFITSTLLLTYLNYIQLGTLNSYNRDYTQLLGAREKYQAKQLKNTTFTFIISSYALVGSLISVIVIMLFKGNIYDYYAFGFIASAIISLLNMLELFATYTARMEGHFNYSAKVSIIKTIIAVSIGLIFIRKIGYFGLYVMPSIAAMSGIIMYFNVSIRNINFNINKQVLIQSIKSGVPLLVNNLIWTIMMSVDKIVILFFMSTGDLGIYSVALLGFSTMVLIPQSISQVFYYKMSIAYGESRSVQSLFDLAVKYTRIVSLFSSMSSVIGYYLLPIFIVKFMPGYSYGIQAAQILLLGVSLYSTTMLFSNIFSILKLNKQLIHNTVRLCGFNIFLSTTFMLVFGKSIENVAIGTAISYALYSLSLIRILTKQFDVSIRNVLSASWLPVLCSLIPCIVASLIFNNIYTSFIATIIISSLCLVIIFRNEIKEEIKTR